ncbi:MAG TPA: hypothetical protein VJ826_14055 [Candidatus Polarisedimenticolaceae bacterium]|nr:hypothetical protein [Candidatus Polarisedimenticolaceae bacterium]
MVVTSGEAITAKLAGLVPVRALHGRNGTKADVLVYETEGRRIAVKDYRARGFLVRNVIGRFLVRRECRAYEAARGAPGLPPFLGRVGPFGLATGWIDARPLSDFAGRRVPDAVFDRLDAILDGLHERGVALADLHHRDVLLGDDGGVHVVDLAAAVANGPFLARAAAQDRLAAARMRARFTGRSEEEALAALDPASVAMWRRGRAAKRLLNRLRGKGA